MHSAQKAQDYALPWAHRIRKRLCQHVACATQIICGIVQRLLQALVEKVTELLARLAWNQDNKDAIRTAGGIAVLLRSERRLHAALWHTEVLQLRD